MSTIHHHSLAAAGALLLATTAMPAPAAAPSTFAFNLPAEPLALALEAIALRTGRNIVTVDPLIAKRQAAPLFGSFTAEQAVDRLLEGSGLRSRQVDGTIHVETEAGPAPAPPAESNAEITVIGTRIRGGGSASPVTMTTRHDLERAGISDLAGFTAVLPQNFTGGQNRGIAGGGEQGGQQNLNDSANLNLRGLGPDATLTLLDGHRLSYDALDQGVDISTIPLSAIERIEVVADGASALYGSDAVGGVANIVLRRDFDGLETTARLGGSTDGGNVQQQYSLLGGRRWSTGGFMVALDLSHATGIEAGQRDYAGSVDTSLSLTNRISQRSALLSAHQQLAPGLTFEVDGTAADRRSLSQNPFFPDENVHVSGIVARPQVRSYSLAPTLRTELGRWQAALGATSASSRTLLDTNNYFGGTARHQHLLYADRLVGVEATAEGPLIALPGGDARLALGGGARRIALHDRYQTLGSGPPVTTQNFTEQRNVEFLYGELSLPFVGPGLGLPLVERLTVSAALRYEHWNGIAAETTPKLGLIYQPVRDVTLRASWGRSFKIPTLLQVNQVQEGDLLPGFIFSPSPQPAGAAVLLLAGAAPNLKPEHATSWSGTMEVRPRTLPGLSLQASYFKVDYRGRIAHPLTNVLGALGNPLYSDLIVYNPSAAAVNALIAGLPGGLINQTGAPFDPAGVGAIVDVSIRNSERQQIQGVDLGADYRTSLAPGATLQLMANASYLQSRQQLAVNQPILPLAGTVFHPPHWRGRAGAAWEEKAVGLSAFVNYVGPTTDNILATPERVAAFVTLDISASIASGARAGPFRNMELRFSALNLLNQKPHPIRTAFPGATPYDSTNESPVGRFLGLSVRKTW